MDSIYLNPRHSIDLPWDGRSGRLVTFYMGGTSWQ